MTRQEGRLGINQKNLSLYACIVHADETEEMKLLVVDAVEQVEPHRNI